MICDQQISLRDFKKEKTANDLAKAAFILADERGLDGFVVNDIVELAGYSRRTFANHFSCKEEAVVMVALLQEGVSKVDDFIDQIDIDTPPIDILYQVMKMQFTSNLLKKLRTLVSLSNRFPTLKPYILSIFKQFQMEAVDIVNVLSHGRYSHEYAYILGGSVYGAMLPLLDDDLDVLFPDQSSSDHSGSMTFEQYVDQAFDHLRHGFLNKR